MLTKINNTPALRASPIDAATAPSGNALGGDPAGFASLLRQSRAAPTPSPAPSMALLPAPKPPPPAAVPTASVESKPEATDPQAKAPTTQDDTGQTDAPVEHDAISRTRTLLKGKLRAADGAAPSLNAAKPAAKPADEPGAAAPTETGAATNTSTAATVQPLDPNLMQLLAHLQRPAAADASSTGERADPGAADALPAGAHAADPKAAAELKDAQAAPSKAAHADTGATAPFSEMLVEERHATLRGEPVVTTDTRTEAAAGASAASALGRMAGTDGSSAAAAAPVAIATPVTAPDFAQELGLRLSVLAKDGIQTAELHLNPADMGPVSVQIVMDGTQARIDFGADMAATRHAIEAGLPELASALRDAGFTLAGGGVSQHAGGRGGQGEPGRDNAPEGQRQRANLAEADVKRVANAARRIVSRGGVDLFA